MLYQKEEGEMKVFILAAGIGTRLSRFSQGKPKCLIKVREQTLIRRMIERLHAHDLKDITLITGYKKELIHEELGDRVQYRHNPFFPVTNSIASLWFARDLIQGDVLITNGDLFYEDKLLDAVLEEKRDVMMLADSTRIKDADYRFRLDQDRIVGYGKDIPVEETDAEYVGMAVIKKNFIGRFNQRLHELIDTQKSDKWWEDVLYSFIPEGVPIHHRDIAGTFWAEVDYVEDYDRIVQWCEKNKP
jgi:L-glutamine-phosphate cytidylyltransferase